MTGTAVPGATAPPLRLPPARPEPARAGFPWIASAAPVAGAVAIWAITGSALALLFAALGPLVAVAAMLDGRRTARRERRVRARERALALEHLRAELARRHEGERAAAWRAAPTARALPGIGAPAWRARPPAEVVVGSGAVPSRVVLEGSAGDDDELAALVVEAGRLDAAPVRVGLAHGLGFVGPPALARAAARAVVLQLAEAVHPAVASIVGHGGHWAWTGALPHRASGAGVVVIRIVEPGDPAMGESAELGPGGSPSEVLLAIAAHVGELPPGVRTAIEATTAVGARLVVEGGDVVPIEPELLSQAEAEAFAGRLAAIARRSGLAAASRAVPDAVRLADLLEPTAAVPGRSSLAATIGVGDGPVRVDLVDGPHAIVAGTSGSGKSEFLVSWIAAMAAGHPPERVAFLLVDFKGGAAFEPVAGLVHVTGTVTDLDADDASRAVTSLRAELRHRERVLAAAGARAIADLPDGVLLPRLVVVIDEFQAMIERFPELGAVVADLAARGRSLGVHLVLAAQRPNGVVREQVSANCGIRISLRVLERADSVAVVGVDAAASLDPSRPGRAIVDRGDGRPVEVQAALADADAIAAVAARHGDARPPRRPWLDRLPARIAVDDVDAALLAAPGGRAHRGIAGGHPTDDPPVAGGLVLGVADDPAEQRRSLAVWRPGADGPVLVLGMPGSGRSTLLDALAQQVGSRHGAGAVLRLGGPRSREWDDLIDLGGAGAGPASDTAAVRLVVVDDVDTRYDAWPDEYRLAAVEALQRLARRGRRGGPAFAASAGRATALAPGLRDAFTTHVLLRHPSRAELVHAGGDGALHRDAAPPGSGQWRGLRAQFVHAGAGAAGAACATAAGRAPTPTIAFPATGVVAVSTSRARVDAGLIARIAPWVEVIGLADGAAAAARAAAVLGPVPAGGAAVVVGDPDTWAANWSLAAAARTRADLVVHGGAAEYRALVRDPALPPLLDPERDQCWRLTPAGTVERLGWPTD
ncbi:hypothetical protein GCM10009819_26650 [Agromyces tropicus]|uniref:FtsK domain-containing protein n=1 Tax=Agromyces tropicus TaxID=555371 RepID=A0ABN2UNK7_9MICO